MDTRKLSTGVSPIIATLLLIAITVAAGVIVYVFVSGAIGNLTQGGGGQQTAQQIELTSYAFTPISGGSTTCLGNSSVTSPCMTISLKNAGGGSVTIDKIYFDGLPLTAVGLPSPFTLSIDKDVSIVLVNAGVTVGYNGLPPSTSITGGSTHVVKIVTSTGGLFSYTVTAGSSQ